MSEDAVSRQTGQPMRCPSCGDSRLVEVERSDVLIDACPSCRGVWLDRGELDKILVQERRLATGDPDEDFFREVEGRRPTAAPDAKPKRKKRSFLEDLLDFD
jgi:Zn-finger nucleic acid-binding protein